jgi:hypothetical protein
MAKPVIVVVDNEDDSLAALGSIAIRLIHEYLALARD